MDSITFLLGLILVNLLVARGRAQGLVPYNVMDFGAIGDGAADDSKAFLKAWDAACSSSAVFPVVVVPAGKTLKLNPPMNIHGPCMSRRIGVQIAGSLVAPANPALWETDPDYWLVFRYVDGLTLTGGGAINGNGRAWWGNLCRVSSREGCINMAPKTLSFLSCNDLNLNNLHFVDSPMFHMHLWNCSNAVFSGLTIAAPEDSPNTDGIHLSNCQHFLFHNLSIATGDDCISIGEQCSDITVSNVECGPGHGISIGSLGRDGERVAVEGITVSNVLFKGSENGARIKTWQGGSGYARNITFQALSFIEVDNPIIIDQYYCGGGSDCPPAKAAVEVSDVRFMDSIGTSSGNDPPIALLCSETVPCTEILLQNITITPARQLGKTQAECISASGMSKGQVVPPVPCRFAVLRLDDDYY